MRRKQSKFIAVDGEGVTYHDDQGNVHHDYVLLSVGETSLHRRGERLRFTDIMPFLYRQHQLNPDATFIGFYLSYDFSQWLKDLHRDQAWLLLHKDGIRRRTPTKMPNPTPWPVYADGWEIDIMAKRRFKLRPMVQGDPYTTKNHWSWMWICDAGPFWQSSFMTAIDPKSWTEPIVTDEEYATIVEGKKQRSSATFDMDMVRYNITENRGLARAMDSLRDGFEVQNWRLNKRQWFGPGQAAEAWLRLIGAPKRETVEKATPLPVLQAGMASYYGGWFEIPRHGFIKGTSHEYDINSAYPFIIAGLPCLLHGRWTHTDSYAVGERISLSGHVLVDASTYGSDKYLGGMPHRNEHGIICRPLVNRGWFWAHELAASMAAGLIDKVAIHESWTYTPCDCRPPLVDIVRLYEQRQRVGKNTVQGKALKLVYNSAYGKFAQSVSNPKYGNPLYASLITSGCRTLILDAIASHPNKSTSVLMVATDGIYFSEPHPTLDLTPNKLGAWEHGTKENMTLFMPGVYWDDASRASLADENRVKIKSRGINGYELAQHIETIDRQFTEPFTEWPSITVPIRFQVTSPNLAVARGKWETCGAVQLDQTRTMSSDPVNKRDGKPYGSPWTTRPYRDAGDNYGYSKRFGIELQDMLDNDDSLTDDGTINTELIELLHPEDT